MFPRTSILPAALAFAALISPALANKKPPPEPINLNTATSEQLQQVPGIGPATADKILQFRKSYGAFKRVDDLRAVRGIGPKRLEKMRKYLVVGKASAAKTATTAKNTAPPQPPPAAKKPPPPLPKDEEPEEQ